MKNDDFLIENDISEVISGLKKLRTETDLLFKAANLAAESLLKNGAIYFCGNGGSAADSQHWAAELTGRFLENRKPYKAIALTTDTSALTAIGNDFGFHQIFSRQLEGLANPTDTLVAISTSGNSSNVVNAALCMKKIGGKVIAFSGPSAGMIDEHADVLIRAEASRTDLIQDIQVVIGHSICKIIEQLLTDLGK